MKKEPIYPRGDPYQLVEECLHGLEEDLYGAAKDARRMMYETILSHLCHMLLIDGGPTFGLEVLEKACGDLRKWEVDRGRKELGPFLSKAHREKLMDSPGRYLRQDIEMTGPQRWIIKDEWYG